jgi:hypothetical protein
VESSGRERLMMDGKAGKAVRSEIHSLEACGVSSAVWVQERAGHKSQGSSPRLEHPVISPGFLPNKDHATCGKERFIGPDCRAITLVGFRVRRLG